MPSKHPTTKTLSSHKQKIALPSMYGGRILIHLYRDVSETDHFRTWSAKTGFISVTFFAWIANKCNIRLNTSIGFHMPVLFLRDCVRTCLHGAQQHPHIVFHSYFSYKPSFSSSRFSSSTVYSFFF